MTADEKIEIAVARARSSPGLDAAHWLAIIYIEERADEEIALSPGLDRQGARLLAAAHLLAVQFRADVEPGPRLRLVPKDDA